MSKPITIVCGLGRSGTSLMMRMLSAGGMPVYCSDFVLLETPDSLELPKKHEWLKDCEGAAVKILDPLRNHPPKKYKNFGPQYEYRFIWMYRDPEQQAKSHLKYQSKLLNLPTDNKRGRKRHYIRTMKKETEASLKLLASYGMPSITVRFEDLINQPDIEARRVAEFIHDTKLDIQKMKDVVIVRSSDCYEGFLETKYAGN